MDSHQLLSPMAQTRPFHGWIQSESDMVSQHQMSTTLTPVSMASLTRVTDLSSLSYDDEDIFLVTSPTPSQDRPSSDQDIYEDSAMTFIIDATCDISTDSIDTSDENQCVPDSLDEDLLSRTRYYSDFMKDEPVRRPSLPCGGDVCTSDFISATGELFTREVEGCEDDDIIPSVNDCTSLNHHQESRSRRSSASDPIFSSTMIEDNSSSPGFYGRQEACFIPRASSTVVYKKSPVKGSDKSSSEVDLRSICTWSIVDDDGSADNSLEESYLQKRQASTSQQKAKLLQHKILASTFVKQQDTLSVIEPPIRDHDLDDSLYENDLPSKSKCLPRSSTRIHLQSSESLNMFTFHSENDFHTVPSSVFSEPPQNNDDIFKVPKQNQQLKNIFRLKRSKGKPNIFKSTSSKCSQPSSVHSDPTPSDKKTVQLINKKAIVKKFKKFSANFNKQDKKTVVTLVTL